MDSCLLCFVVLIITCSLEKVCCSQCDATFYDPVPDCSLHPLRIGYYPSPTCGNLHVLTDADGRPNAEFARLGYHSGTDSYYHEYSSGRYLSIALTKRAKIYAVAVEGSPRNLRYYLKSMEIWYKVSASDFNVTRGSAVFEDFYKENGIRKRFIANMVNQTKFVFTNQFFADEVRIYPITFHGDKVFRVELYGCYLGRITAPSSIGINNPTMISMDRSQDASLAKYRYYVKISEPNGNMIVLDMNSTVTYNFTSHGKGVLELGLNYSNGWLSTDKLEVVIQGPLNGLTLTLDGSEVSPYIKQERLDIEFYLGTSIQHYQLKRYHFSFGDGSSLTHNYCKHQYTRGIYNAVATASNDFFSTNLTRSVVICPMTSPAVSYQPYRSSAFRVEYLGPAVVYNLTVTFYALHNTIFNLSVNFSQVQIGKIYAIGHVLKQVTLANPVTAPSKQHFRFQYSDACRMYDSQDIDVFVDERVAGVSLELNQTFKSSLIHPVPHYFKNYPIDFYIDVKNGTTVSCYVYSGVSATALVADKYFKATRTYTSGSRVSVYASCSNRLQVTARSPSITIDLREVPEVMTNFSLELPTKIMRVGQSFDLLIAFVNGNEMTCNITSITAGISKTYIYSQLVARQESHNSGGKAYRVALSTSIFSLAHQLDVVCRNVRNEVRSNVKFQSEEPVTNLGLSFPKLLCFNETLPVRVTTSQGRPLLGLLYINGTKHLEYYSTNGSSNIFHVQPAMYGEPGWKEVVIRAGNNISTVENFAQVRVARKVTNLSVLVNFTISSNQALERRPANLLPINERVNFTAFVTPRAEGYLYRWSINGNMSVVLKNTSYWYYTFNTSGRHLLELEVFGCNNFTYQQYFMVLEPITDFLVTIHTYPVVLVGAPFLVNVTIPSNSDCIDGYFGHANTTITRCRNDSLNGTFCDFSSAVCNKETSFHASGNYSVKITSSNGLYQRSKAYNLIAKSCKSPTISVQGSNTDSNAGKLTTQAYRSSPLTYQVTSVNTSCELSHSYTVHWAVHSPWYGANSGHLVPNVNLNIENNNRTLKIPCCTLSYGQFNVRVTVRIAGHDLIDGKFHTTKPITGYVNDTDLVPNLKETGGNYSYAYNSTISLTAEESYDPDKFTQNLSFTWYCRDIALEPRDIFSLSNIPVISSSYFVQKINANFSLNSSMAYNSISGVSSKILGNGSFESTENFTYNATSKVMLGCFGKPFGRLDVSNATASISFNSAYLQENHTIEFLVVVKGATPLRLRRSTAGRKIYVRSRETPYFEIRCIENCAGKVAPAEKLTLRVICKSDSCERRASFLWSMLENGRPVSLAGKIYSQPTDRDFYMKPNTVSVGSHCRLTLRGTAQDGAIFQRVFEFIVNKAPENGNCTLSPLSGIAIKTNFKINCTGWADSEQPISYEVAHYTRTLTTIGCKTTKGSCEAVFPVGQGKNSSLNIRVRVIDALSMFTDFYFVIKVTAGKLTLKEMDKYLNLIKNGANREKTTQLISAVTSVLNVDKDPNKSSKYLKKSIELREASTLRLAEMVSIDTIDSVAPITAAVADMPSQFSQEAGNRATNAIVQMTGLFSANKADYIFRDIVDQGKSILNAIGMVSKSTSVNLDPHKVKQNQTNSTEGEYLLWTKDVGRQVIINATSAFENITDAMLSRLSPYDGQISLPTRDLALVLKKSFATELNKTSKLSVLNNNVVIPSLQNLRIENGHSAIGLLMKVTTFNPYFWGTSSKRINSTVTDLEFRASNLPLVVKNTKEPIKFQIKREVKQPIPFQHWKLQQRLNQESVNFHKFFLNYESSLHLELKPMNYCMNYNIYIKYGSRPSRDDYLKNWTLPDLRTCNNTGHQEDVRANICAIYREVVESSLQHLENRSEEIVNCSLMATLRDKIRDALAPCTSDPYKVYLLDSETKNGVYYIGIYDAERRSLQEAVPALLYNSSNDCQIADIDGQSSYFVRGYTSKCRYWEPTGREQWMSDGCYVEKETNPSTVHCRCNHLTTFAADFLISPNPIDIDRVIEGFKNIKDNVSVLVLTSLLLAIYIILLASLRRKDKLDAGKLNVTVIDGDNSKPYEYLVLFVTGARINAGSTAHVFCCLNSESMVGEPKLLLGSEKRPFQRDQIDAFKISFSKPLGDISDIRIWHDNAGCSPGWYLSRIYVEDLQSNKRVLFICEQWLAVELEDGLIDRIIPAASYDDKKLFTHLFTTKAAKDLSDQHLWLSVALKRPHDTFTRAQRLTCCMSLLFTTMLASAMFFQLGSNSKYLWKIGSLVIDYKGIIIGIQSGLIVIPINFAIVWIFRHTESFEYYRQRRQNRKAGLSDRRNTLLPCGFLIIAWFLALISILASFVVVLFYSMQWGDNKSQQFVLSVFTSFVQSAFLIQPLKLVFIAIILAAIFKKTDDETGVLDSYKYSAQEEVIQAQPEVDMSNLQTSPLTEEQLKYARKRRHMEIRLKVFLQDLVSYTIFLTFLALVVRGYRDPDEYYFRKALEDDIVHQHFKSIQDVPGVWTWVQQHFIPAIYTQQWYNGENFTNFKMLQNQEAYRIGLARIRQLRIKPGSCKVWKDMAQYFNTCDDFYSLSFNEERSFDVGWKNTSTRKRRSTVELVSDQTDWIEVEPKAELSKDSFAKKQSLHGNAPGISTHELVMKNIDSQGNFKQLKERNDSEAILKRRRRALKFKIRRKTIQILSVLKHPDVISIDEQYLLPNGEIKPNKQHWLYNDMSSLRGFPYYGHFATYSGGGYVASLSTDIDFARATVMALEQDSWVDMLTRALFFEFSVYNANMNFFATGFVIIEILPTGSVVPNANIRVFKLYRYVGTFGRLVMASEIILLLCLLFFIYKECRHMYRLGWGYFKLFWSWIEIIIAVALFTALILRAFSWYEGDKNLIAHHKNMEQFINFHYTVVADDALLLSITIICFASTLKLIKLLNIFPIFMCLKETIHRSVGPMASYFIPFCIAFFGFASLAHLLFNSEMLFSSYIDSCQTQLLMLIGGSVYYALRRAHSVLGPLFFFMFAAFETCILLNIFLTIINESIKDSAYWKAEAKRKEFVDFVEDRVRAIFNLKPTVKSRQLSTNQNAASFSKKSTVHAQNTTKSPTQRDVAACEATATNSLSRRMTFYERTVQQTNIHRSSILGVLNRNRILRSGSLSYVAHKKPSKTNVAVTCTANDNRTPNAARIGHKDEMELIIEDLCTRKQTDKLFEELKAILERLGNFIEDSIEDDVIDLKIDLVLYCMC